jgi:quercetin dioxygenase-like cupin family protein
MKKDKAMKKSYWLFGTRLTVLATHADTAGRYDLVENVLPPGAQIPPHRHTRYSEQLYVLEGELTAWAGERKVVLRHGENVFIPVGTPHSLAATGDGHTRALVVASPSGFARLVTETGTPDDGDGAPPSASFDVDRFLRIAAELGDELLGPPGALPTNAGR